MSLQVASHHTLPAQSIVEGRRNAGDLKKRAFAEVRAWKAAFFVTLVVLGSAVGALVYVALSPPFVPFAVAVDQHGVAFPIGPASQARAEDPALIASELNRWITHVRTVTSDPYAQEQMVRQAYAYVTAGAGKVLNAYFRDPANDPRVIAQRSVRQVDVRSALPLKPGSPEWVLLWNERTIDRGSGMIETTTWQAYITVKRLLPPKRLDRRTEEQARSNPFRLYITDLS